MQVEIFSDIVCPWCAIGKARFERALALFDHGDEVEVIWRSFELDVNAPRDRDTDLAAHLAAKYGTSLAEAKLMLERVTAAAAAEGLDFRFDDAKPGNTFDAHRLLHLAKEHGLQHEMGRRLFDAYFTQGRAIASHDVLQQLAAEAGLDEVEAKEVLVTDAYASAVRADEALAASYGVRGVPFFVVDQRYGVSGAQPAEALLEVLETAWAEASPLTMVAGPTDDVGDTCEDGDCAV